MNDTAYSKPVKYRKTMDPELVAGTAFDGVQPGDVVRVRLRSGGDELSPVFVIDMRLTGNRKSPVLGELRRAQSEWLKTRKSLETVSKQIAPLIAARARLTLTLKAVTEGFDEKLGRL